MLNILKSGIKTNKIIIVEIDKIYYFIFKKFFHLRAAIFISTRKICFRFKSYFLVEKSCKSEINEHVLLESLAEHNVSWFDIHVHDVELM